MTHFRAQFQTPDGRTHAVVDSGPITVQRLCLVEALVTGAVQVGEPVPPLIDLSATPPAWLQAAEMAQVQRA